MKSPATLRNASRFLCQQGRARAFSALSGKAGQNAAGRSLLYVDQGMMTESVSGSRSYFPSQKRFIRREPISQAQRQAEMEEEARRVDLDPAKCLKKGDPGTMQGIIKDVMPVGYFVTLPNGREGYLPATDLGITGGVVLLERLMKVGQEITVRIDCRGGGGREILSMKRPECVPVINDRFGLANLSRNYKSSN